MNVFLSLLRTKTEPEEGVLPLKTQRGAERKPLHEKGVRRPITCPQGQVALHVTSKVLLR